MILILLPLLVLAGCAYGPPLPDDEFGKATRCHWLGTIPYACSYDPSRVTVEIETLQDAIDRLERVRTEEHKRRSL